MEASPEKELDWEVKKLRYDVTKEEILEYQKKFEELYSSGRHKDIEAYREIFGNIEPVERINDKEYQKKKEGVNKILRKII